MIYIWPKSKVRGSLLLIKPEPEGWGIYHRQTFDDWGQGWYICQIHHNSCGWYDIYYGDIILVCFTSYLHWKQLISLFCTFLPTYWVRLIQDRVHWSNHGVARDQWIQISALSNWTERRIYAYIAITLNSFIVMWSWKPDICQNGGQAQFIERKCWLCFYVE